MTVCGFFCTFGVRERFKEDYVKVGGSKVWTVSTACASLRVFIPSRGLEECFFWHCRSGFTQAPKNSGQGLFKPFNKEVIRLECD